MRKVLIIGIDGCRPDALAASETPTLDTLILDGAYSDRALAGDRTTSGAGWSSMLTGVGRHKHGVPDNLFWGKRFDEYPHFFARLRAARPDAYTASVVSWEPIHEHILDAAVHEDFHPHDDEVTRRACTVLAQTDVDALFVHLDGVDAAGHDHGFHPRVREYRRAIEAVDERVGALLDAMRARQKYADEDWLVLVSTDHGGLGRTHGGDTPSQRRTFLIAHGAAVRPGPIHAAPAIEDVAATALAHLGVPLQPEWDLDGQPVGLHTAVGSSHLSLR